MLAVLVWVGLVVSTPIGSTPMPPPTHPTSLIAAATPSSAGPTSSPIGFMTFNVQALPFAHDNRERLSKAAVQLSANSDIDIVAFQEVFEQVNGEGRAALVSGLSRKFPNFSPSTYSKSQGSMDSSGTVIFSKFPLLPMRHPMGREDRITFPISDSDTWLFDHQSMKSKGFGQRFLFTRFPQATGADSLAAKGVLVALVDISKKFLVSAPDSGSQSEFESKVQELGESGFANRQMLLVFSMHAQSENTNPEAIQTRRAQLAMSKKFISDVVAANTGPGSMYEKASVGTVLLGDLNEDFYWKDRASTEPFLKALGNPMDIYAAANLLSKCDNPPCVDPVCDKLPTLAVTNSNYTTFWNMDQSLNQLIANDSSLTGHPPFSNSFSWKQKCGFTCCLERSGSGFSEQFHAAPERLDYILFFGQDSEIPGKLAVNSVLSADVQYANEWVLSDHLAVQAIISLKAI